MYCISVSIQDWGSLRVAVVCSVTWRKPSRRVILDCDDFADINELCSNIYLSLKHITRLAELCVYIHVVGACAKHLTNA